ncbi:MAG: peptidoglycan-associated lipoprotein Pal [Gammaproteobacteria bacterium]|nr:peptidoglycan-associated lipoprotein Pal [Gammaproteobacteria bacterium]
MFIVGCQSTGQELSNDPSLTDGQSQTDGSSGAGDTTGSDITSLDGSDDTSMTPIVEEDMTVQQMLDEPGSALANRIIYFDFDSAKISDESLALLEAHGNFIAGNGNVSVRLEGHTDERGSREYNIALGDRRAQSVRRVLLFQGASVDQLDTVSYGEEQPAMLGHTEDAWSKNRRVELVYNVN